MPIMTGFAVNILACVWVHVGTHFCGVLLSGLSCMARSRARDEYCWAGDLQKEHSLEQPAVRRGGGGGEGREPGQLAHLAGVQAA